MSDEECQEDPADDQESIGVSSAPTKPVEIDPGRLFSQLLSDITMRNRRKKRLDDLCQRRKQEIELEEKEVGRLEKKAAEANLKMRELNGAYQLIKGGITAKHDLSTALMEQTVLYRQRIAELSGKNKRSKESLDEELVKERSEVEELRSAYGPLQVDLEEKRAHLESAEDQLRQVNAEANALRKQITHMHCPPELTDSGAFFQTTEEFCLELARSYLKVGQTWNRCLQLTTQLQQAEDEISRLQQAAEQRSAPTETVSADASSPEPKQTATTNSWRRRSHASPASLSMELDTNKLFQSMHGCFRVDDDDTASVSMAPSQLAGWPRPQTGSTAPESATVDAGQPQVESVSAETIEASLLLPRTAEALSAGNDQPMRDKFVFNEAITDHVAELFLGDDDGQQSVLNAADDCSTLNTADDSSALVETGQSRSDLNSPHLCPLESANSERNEVGCDEVMQIDEGSSLDGDAGGERSVFTMDTDAGLDSLKMKQSQQSDFSLDEASNLSASDGFFFNDSGGNDWTIGGSGTAEFGDWAMDSSLFGQTSQTPAALHDQQTDLAFGSGNLFDFFGDAATPSNSQTLSNKDGKTVKFNVGESQMGRLSPAVKRGVSTELLQRN